jgi:hypothetical protein
VPTEDGAQRGPQADGHEAVVPGLVGLEDAYVLDACALQARAESLEGGLVGHAEDDGVGTSGQVPCGGLARGMHKLRGQGAYREITSDHDEVGQRVCDRSRG